jgi:glycosidase
VQVRKEHESVRKGTYETLIADNQKHLFAFRRSFGSDFVIAVFNSGESAQYLDFTEAEESVDVQPHSVKIITKS